MNQQTFKGSLKECLSHANETYGLKLLKPLVHFTGSTHENIKDWLKGRHYPLGLYALKLCHFLEVLGYTVKELHKTDCDQAYLLGKCIAFDLVDLETAYLEMNYSEKNQVLRMVFGKKGVHKQKFDSLKNLTMLHIENLEKRFKALKNELTESLSEKNNEDNGYAITYPIDGNLSPKTKEALIDSLAGHINADLPLLSIAASDIFTPEDREKLREKVGPGVIPKLSVVIIKLSGERARDNATREEKNAL